jgi:hypothetical protein
MARQSHSHRLSRVRHRLFTEVMTNGKTALVRLLATIMPLTD